MLLVPNKIRKLEARELSCRILNYFNIKFPEVPIKYIIKQYGCLFYFKGENPESREDAGFCLHDGSEYQIYINKELPSGIDNFAYAHELGHVALNHLTQYDIKNLSDHQLWLLNREADIFATNLLMPENMMRHFVKDCSSVQSIGYYKDLFGVSWGAFTNRLDELKIIPKNDVQYMFAVFNEKKKKDQELLFEWAKSITY